MEDGYAGMRNYLWGGMTLAYLYSELAEGCLPGDRQIGGSVTLLTTWFLAHFSKEVFEEVFWYSGWIICSVRKVYRHLPERVLRQYGYVQTVPRHPSDVVELSSAEIVQTFVDFRTHTLKAADWSEHA
ncbi:hypothetical protein MtrunA17_Chr3g0136941 [Medicago truncatula]|uniref:Aminotransferase-like plant mobile domain-containing protein n=1 Tax=Medicago truncatula TaxID=3880 RepID=A0A396IXX9_MEDTR|nr:hypothetical protein MtrunA17_Chr3g0136941 [Medicago truncatula]